MNPAPNNEKRPQPLRIQPLKRLLAVSGGIHPSGQHDQ
jgi:hypothetical protein